MGCEILFLVYLQTLLAAVNAKKAEGGPWIDTLTSRHPEHLQKGDELFMLVCLSVVIALSDTLIFVLSTVLMEMEMECGQNIDHIFEKRFSGDFRLGLKVLGNILFCCFVFF